MKMHEEGNERFEQELRGAMQRVNAPESLQQFLMKAAEAEAHRIATGKAVARKGKILAFPAPRAWFGGAIAAVLAIGCFSLEGVHLHREHKRQQADRQFEEAQQITSRTLEEARERLERKGISLGE